MDSSHGTTETIRSRAAGQATRSRVLRAAIELFAEQGYHSTGIRELSERAAIGRGALYYHIRSKEDLLFDIARTKLEQHEAGARKIVESDAGTLDKLRRLSHHAIDGMVGDREGWIVVSWETRALEGEYREVVNRLRKTYQQHWKSTLDDAAAEGLLRPADPVEVSGFMGMFNYTLQWMTAGGKRTPDDIADRYYNLIVGALAA